jgi:hypothetical protein
LSDTKDNLGNLGHFIEREARERTLSLEVVEDFSGSLKGHCSYVGVIIGTLICDVVGPGSGELDEQMAFCREPFPVADQSQSSVSDVTCEGGTSLDQLAILGIKGVLSVDHEDRLATDLTIDAGDGGLVVSSQVFCDVKTMMTVVDQVGVDTLANLDGEVQEVRESWWNRDGSKVLLDREVLPAEGRSKLGLGKHRESSGSNLGWSRSRHTRLAGDELAVGILVGKTVVGK